MSRAIGSPHILGGHVRCGYCGYSMTRRGTWFRGGYYGCGNNQSTGNCRPNTYAIRHLEPAVLEYLFRMVEDKCAFENVQRNLEEDKGRGIEQEISQLEKTIADIPQGAEKVFALYETGRITQDEFSERRAALHEMAESGQRALAQRKKELEKLRGSELGRETFAEALRTLKDRFKTCAIAEQKAVLASIVDHITSKDKTFKVHVRYLAPTE